MSGVKSCRGNAKTNLSLLRQLVALTPASLASVMVHAQSADQGAKVAPLEEIIVSAQKRDESILKVPLAVAAVDGDRLLRENLATLESFAERIPGVVISGANATDISIRGINTGNATAPSVAITIDDVPFGSSGWAGNTRIPNLDPAEIQRVEVLRGPQGTLYGASSLGGLIKYVTRAPDSNEFSGRVEAGLNHAKGGTTGSYIRGSINVPLISDRLGLRLSGYHREEPEYADRYDRVTGAPVERNVNEEEIEGFRAAMRLQATDNFVIDVAHLEQDIETSNSPRTQLVLGSYRPMYDYFSNNATESQAEHHLELTTLNFEWTLGNHVIKSVSGWGKTEYDNDSDNTATFSFVFNGIPFLGIAPVYPDAPAGSQVRLVDARSTKKFSQELRIFSEYADSRVQWMLGAFYTDEESLMDQDMFAVEPNGARIGPVVAFPLPSTFEEKAVFGNVSYQVTDRFDIELGARCSENDQTYQANQTVAPGAVPLFGPSNVGEKSRSSDNSFTWHVSPSFRLTDDVMVYARVASGYRAGGPNSAIAPTPSFAPDTVVNAELGLKGTFLDNRLILDTAVYNIEWDDVQLGATTPAGVSYFVNGGEARSRGLEVSVQLKPAYGWRINVSVNVAESELSEDLPVQAAGSYLIGASGDKLPYAADFSASVGIEEFWHLTDTMQLTVGGTYSYLGERDSAFRSSSAPVDRRNKLIAPSYDQLDAFVRVENGPWAASLYMRNLTDERGIRSLSDGGGTSSSFTASFLQPRMFGLSVSYDF
jgi:iron complex outermembrane receptor protein